MFIQILIEHSLSKQWRTRSEAADLVLHCLLMFYKKDARLIWVKVSKYLYGITVLIIVQYILFQEIVKILPSDPIVLKYCSQVSDGKISSVVCR